MIKRLTDEAGYSLVEVLASIVILTIAIIPMVAMFDMGLKSASTSGNYDKARAFANKKLEQAKSLSYSEVRGNFPRTGDGTPTTGSPATIDNTTEAGLPNGFNYSVVKRYKCVSGSSSSCTTPTGGTSFLANSSTDIGVIEIAVTVGWGESNSYTTTGVKAK